MRDERVVLLQLLQTMFGNPQQVAIGDVGQVISIQAGSPKITLTIRPAVSDVTDATYDIAGVGFLASYVPVVNDIVQFIRVGGSPYVVGAINGDFTQRGKTSFTLTAANGVNSTITYPIPLNSSPSNVQALVQIGSNLDVCVNLQSLSATQSVFRLFQNTAAAVSGSGTLHWEVVGR
jgi:hypothetical protein